MKPLSMLPALALVLVCSACTSFRKPAAFDDAFLRERAVTETKEGFRVSGALLQADEVEAVFGLDLGRKGIQPVWLEVENHSEHPVYLLLSGVDPEYFAPLEVGHAFHATFAGTANKQLDEHVSERAIDHRSPIAPGSSVSGFVYTNPSREVKVVDIDLLGHGQASSITLFLPDPANQKLDDLFVKTRTRFSEPELVQIEDADRLREALEGLPCCAQDTRGEHLAPLNLVIVGELEQWLSGFLRRGYRYYDVSPLFVFQRPQDTMGKKGAQWVDAQQHVVRAWQTPLRFRSAPVWLAQASTPRGGRFTTDLDSIDEACDDARNDLVEDLLYCQNLAKIGFVKGAGCPQGRAAGVATDGLRVLMVFEERMIDLAEIDFFDWERLADHR